MIKPYDYQKVFGVKDTKSRSISSASSKFGDEKLPSKEIESFKMYDELVEAQIIYDEYYKLRILKLLFSSKLRYFNAFTCNNGQLSIPVFCTIELVKLKNSRSIMKRSMLNMKYQKTRKELKSEDVCSKSYFYSLLLFYWVTTRFKFVLNNGDFRIIDHRNFDNVCTQSSKNSSSHNNKETSNSESYAELNSPSSPDSNAF